jgi:hypothetical protein
MDLVSILQEIDAGISRLQQARAILSNTEDSRAVGRPKSRAPYKRVFTEEGRAKIAAAQRVRWAKSKRADKKTSTKRVAKKLVKAIKPVKEDKTETQN